MEQVWDYALDLKYFHQKSHDLWIAPVLVATRAHEFSTVPTTSHYDDMVLEPLCCSDESLRNVLHLILNKYGHSTNPPDWAMSPYNPTPTIIQAATALYRRKNLQNKSIADITRSDASGRSLERTSNAVLNIIRESEREKHKSICFVTGVPGAGKTLVGLNIAIALFDANKEKSDDEDRSLAVYLSGNGPLVKVLREALARDAVEQKHPMDDLHLAVSQRSFRAENLSNFVKQLLDVNVEAARNQFKILSSNYPIVLTRDLEKAKEWLRSKARGSERYGLLVSSQAYRLRPLSIDVRCKPDTVHWFLDDVTDIRSSLFLEDVATEFDVQGLELDWAGVVWDGDMIYDPEHVVLSARDRKKPELTGDMWTHRSFNGGAWQNIASSLRQMYQINAYRVLLTRARQGMIICVPYGNDDKNIDGSYQDTTRLPIFYDNTYNYLKSLGIKDVDE